MLLEGRDVIGQGPDGVRENPGLRRPSGRAVRPIGETGAGAGVGPHTGTGYPGDGSDGGDRFSAGTALYNFCAEVGRSGRSTAPSGAACRSSSAPRAARWTIFDRVRWTCSRCSSPCWTRRTRCWTGASHTTSRPSSAGPLSNRQTALLSATMPGWVAKTAKKHLRNPALVKVDANLRALPTVKHLGLRHREKRQDGRPPDPAGCAGPHGSHRLWQDQTRREEAGEPTGRDGLSRWGAPRQPQPERPRARHGGIPLRRHAHPGSHQRGGSGAGLRRRWAGHQLRLAGTPIASSPTGSGERAAWATTARR